MIHRAIQRERGVTLVVALLLLLVVTLATVAAITGSTSNQRVVGNMVARQEAMSAAQLLIDETVSSATFTVDPAGIAAQPYPVDVDGDGNADYEARLDPQPVCLTSKPLKVNDLDVEVDIDRACLVSAGAVNSGVESTGLVAAAGDSLCSTTTWHLRARVDDDRTGASIGVNQGVGIRSNVADAVTFCQ